MENNDEITIYLNGEPYNCVGNISIEILLKYLNFNIDLVAVEYNNEIVEKEKWDEIILTQGDKLEILTIVGGG